MAAVPVAVGLNDGMLKPLVHRIYLGILSYPSGHTAAMFALAVIGLQWHYFTDTVAGATVGTGPACGLALLLDLVLAALRLGQASGGTYVRTR